LNKFLYRYLKRALSCDRAFFIFVVQSNAFDIYTNTTLTSISFHVNDKSVVGAELNVELYETNGQIWLEESDSYTLTASDIGSWVTLPLLTPYPLFAGTSYMASVRGSQHPTDTSLISSTTNPNTSRYLQDNCGSGDWYTVSKALLIRMNFGGLSSVVNQYSKFNFDIYPNPSLGEINIISYNTDKLNIELVNTLGQVVYVENDILLDSKRLDLEHLDSGIYILRIKNSKTIFSRKFIIE
jgi:hypothetical protein|tara:strand:+ start:2747 stop:3466 length:720 start_codon:yes stop_codon:yes gene_type:complete